MKSILCGIIILASASSLFSSEITTKKPAPIKKKNITKPIKTSPNQHITKALNTIENGLTLFHAGEGQQAKPLLLNGYNYLQKYDPTISTINLFRQDIIYRAVIQTHLKTKDLSAKDIDTAISFGYKFNAIGYNAPAKTRTFLMNIATQARTQGNNVVADLCHAKIIETLEREWKTNPAVTLSTYKDLYNNSQWDYLTYETFLETVGQLELDGNSLRQERKNLNKIMREISLLADNDCMPAQCFLIDTYMKGRYHIAISHKKALIYCQRFILSMAKLSRSTALPREYSIVTLALKELSFSNPNALSLYKYYNLLSARMTNKTEEIEQYCAHTKEDCTFPYENTIIQILSRNPIYLKKVIEITPYDIRLGKLDTFSKQLLLQELQLHKAKLYTTAITHFLKLCALQENELFVECFNLEKEFATRLQSNNCTAGTEYAKAVFSNKLNTIHTVDLEKLINHKQYCQAWEKIYYLLLSPKTRSSACQALTNIDAAREDNPIELDQQASLSCHRADAYQMLEQLITQKDHPAYVCHCLSKHYQQKSRHSHADTATAMSLNSIAAKHLQCTLTHGRWSDAADLQSTCTALTNDVLNYCRQEILKLAALPRGNRLVYQSSAVKETLENLSATNTIASDLYDYYNRILNSTSTILVSQKNSSLLDIVLETVLADSLYPVAHLKRIESAQSTDKGFNELYRADSILPQLITEKLKAFSSNNRAVPNALNSFLGQWNYRSKSYKKAFAHLALCNNHVNDLELQYLLFETHCLSTDTITVQTVQTGLAIIEKILPIVTSTHSNKQKHTTAQTQFLSRLTAICPAYIETLLNQKEYTDAYKLLECIMQQPEMRKIAYTLLTKIETALMQKPLQLRTQLSSIPSRLNVHKRTERFAKKKTHSADICQCMGNIFAQEATNSTLDTATITSLKQKSLDFLHCTLTHGNWSENEIDSLKKQCLQFAQELSDYRTLYQLQQKKSQTNTPGLRPLIEDLLCCAPHNATFEKIDNLIPESKKLLEFYETDWPIALPLLLKKLESLNGANSPISQALHMIIGLYRLHEKDLPQAREHFLQCTHNKDNLLLQALKLKTCLVEDALPIISHIMPRLSIARKSSQPSPQDTFAINMVFNLLNVACKDHTKILIEENKYAEAYQLASFLLQEPETHRAGLHTLYAVEKKVATECDGIESISVPNRSQAYATLEQIAAQSNHNHIICCCLGNLFHLQSLNQLTSPENCIGLKKEFLKYFRCLLTHDDISQETRNNAQLSCANVAYDLGHSYRELDDISQAVSYFKQAAEYGRPEAWLTAAKILIKQSSDMANGTEIVDLLDKHAHSNATNRLESCLFLVEQFLDMHTITDKQHLLHYLTIAENCGNYTYAFWLGLLYHNGVSIKTNNNEESTYYLKPDHDKALFYYKKHLELDGNITYPRSWGAAHSPEHLRTITLYRMANILYHQEKMEDAYSYITQAFLYPLPLEEEIGSHTLAGLIQMCATSEDAQPKGLEHLRFLAEKLVELATMGSITNPITQETFFPVFFMTNRAFTAAHQITSHILTTQNTSPDSISWCTIIGWSLSLSKKQELHRKHGIACLKFAADNGSLAAQLKLLSVQEQECSNFEKLYYIEAAHNIPNNIQNIMRVQRNEVSPGNIKNQAEFILYCASKNNPDALKSYCSRMYNYNSPTAIVIEPDLALNLLAQCSQVALVKTNADNFLKNPQSATPEELFSAMLLGSLGSCCPSSSKQELMAASRYLQTIYDLKSPMHRIEIQRNLSTIYYKLGWLFSRPSSTNTLLSIAYLEKAASLHNVDAICLLSQKWLNGVPETEKIPKEKIVSWLQYADALAKNDLTALLLQEYNNQYPSKTGTTSTKPLVIERTEAEMLQKIAQQNTAIKEAYAQAKKEREQKNHPAYPLLVHSVDVPLSIEFIRARDLYNANRNGDFTPFRKIADTATPDPGACFNLLMFHFIGDKKLDSAKKYLRNGIIASIIKPSPSTARFNSYQFLTMIFMFIDDQLLNSKYDKLHRSIMLKELKKTLVEQKIDINAFAHMFKVMTNKDISKHPAWK